MAAVLAISALCAPAAEASINPGTVTVPVPAAQSTDLQLIGIDTFVSAAVRNGGSVVAADAKDGDASVTDTDGTSAVSGSVSLTYS